MEHEHMKEMTGQIEVSDFFDRCFEKGLFLEFEPEERERARRLLDLFQIRKGMWIMEPGCGCGRMTRLLAERVGPKGRIDAFEISAKMFDYCLANYFPSWVHFHNKSAKDFESRPNSVDGIVCFNVWPHLSPAEDFLASFHRILKPDGRLHIAHSSGRDRINAIHKNSPEGIIQNHLLPPARDLARHLEELGWETGGPIDEAELYYVGAVKQ